MNQDDIEQIYDTFNAGKTWDATELGRNKFSNPWVINIARSYVDTYGRLPTPNEVEEATPAFSTPGGRGESFIASKFMAEQHTPDKIAERQRAQYSAKAPEHFGGVDALFQSKLGRSATEAEKAHFGQLLASGEVDDYTLGSFLEQLPEYRDKQDTDFRSQQRSEFEKADTDYFNEKLLPSIQQNFARQGRSVESSGFASALAQAAKSQAADREKYLAGLSADMYRGRTGAAREDYKSYLDRLYGNQDYNRARTTQLYDSTTARRNELEDFNIQRAAYDDYIRRYGKRKGGLLGVGGQLLGAGIGALAAGIPSGGLGAGQGALLGSQVGGAFGQIGDYYR